MFVHQYLPSTMAAITLLQTLNKPATQPHWCEVRVKEIRVQLTQIHINHVRPFANLQRPNPIVPTRTRSKSQ